MIDENLHTLINQTYNEKEDLAIFAIRQLKAYDSILKVERLIDIIEQNKSEKKVEYAIYSLATTQPIKYVIKILLKQLYNKKEEICSIAAWLLSKYDIYILPDLKNLLKNRKISMNDRKALWLLGQIGGKDEIEFLDKLEFEDSEDLIFLIDDVKKTIIRKNVSLWFEKKND